MYIDLVIGETRIKNAEMSCYTGSMEMKQLPLVIGNWKMNPVALPEAISLFTAYKVIAKKYPRVTIAACIPSLYLSEAVKKLSRSSVRLGVQNIHHEPSGPFTGEISLEMATQFGVTYTVVGHSERRALGETDNQVADKVAAAVKNRVTPILCVGEITRDEQATFYRTIANQITTAIAKLPKNRIKDVVIAYEPVWAIGTGKIPTLDEVREMRLFIHKVIAENVSVPTAKAISVIYGGSVNAGNAHILYGETGMDGFLVGGASLKAAEFETIIREVHEKK
jgi:triosephosphate isomerase